ncbi:MAG: SixA phosphatase family protein [Chitinophagales bacterium]
MKISFILITVCIFFFSCTRMIYIVRHAEKASSADSLAKMMTSDPPLSEAGKVRALVLKDELRNKHIKRIYSTNTTRTMSTAAPLSGAIKVSIELYGNIDSLVNILKSDKGNALVVGHSNTVDDIVNKLCGQTKLTADLSDGEYDNLFIIKLKGKKIFFNRRKYGYPSNP